MGNLISLFILCLFFSLTQLSFASEFEDDEGFDGKNTLSVSLHKENEKEESETKHTEGKYKQYLAKKKANALQQENRIKEYIKLLKKKKKNTTQSGGTLPVTIKPKVGTGTINSTGSTTNDIKVIKLSQAYSTPGGNETVGFEISLKNNIITSVNTSVIRADNTSTYYINAFGADVTSNVKGKTISEASQVSTIAGASLTTNAFTTALKSIK